MVDDKKPMFLFFKKNIFVIWLTCISHFEIFWDKHWNCEAESHHYGERSHLNGSHCQVTQTADPSSNLVVSPRRKTQVRRYQEIRQTGRSSCLIDWKRSELCSGWLCVHPHTALGRFSHLPNLSQSFLQPNVKRNCFSSQITYQARLVRSRRI